MDYGQYHKPLVTKARSSPVRSAAATTNGPWILAATILGSSMAFIDGTVVNVALPAFNPAFVRP
jgi:hypothetical protein